jgi:ornithine cyclodeaminase
MNESDLLGDLYDLAQGAAGRISDGDITIFKNAGGAHLDTMTAEFLLRRVETGG